MTKPLIDQNSPNLLYLVLPAVAVVPMLGCRLMTSMKSVRAGPRVVAGGVKAVTGYTQDKW